MKQKLQYSYLGKYWVMGLGLVVVLSGCGGGGSSDSGATNNVAPASLTTATDVAKSVAAVLVAYHVNNEGYYLAGEDIFDPANTYTCASGGSYVVSNKSAPDSEDGVVRYANCKKSTNMIITGSMAVTCPNSECDPTQTSATQLNYENNLVGGLKFGISGSYKWSNGTVPSIIEKMTWTGKIDFQRSGLNSSMDLMSGLVSDVYSGGAQRSLNGAIALTGGNGHNCLDGAFSYKTISHLNTPSLGMGMTAYKTTVGELEISTNGVVAGTATFSADGGVKIKMATNTVDIPFSQLEGYCNLKETYDLLK